jgi:hypothetical protein
MASALAGECKPSALNIPGSQCPCVYPDHRAMFRVIAPTLNDVAPRLFK